MSTTSSKKMGVVQLTTVTAINMMGSGIILLPATLAEVGTISIFSWILASVGATLLAYAFAKCGMFTTKTGGMGGYAEYRFGRIGNFLSNFCYTISLIIANAAIASGVVSYGSYVFKLDLDPVEVCLATIGVLLCAATISLVGPKKFGKFTSLGMICIVIPVAGLLLFGWHYFDSDIYWTAWNPQNLPFLEAMKNSIAVIIWAFLGLETACANSNTVENPKKNVPRAVLAGTLISGIFYTTSTAIIGGLVPYEELMSSGAPFGLAFASMFGEGAGYVISILLVISCFVSLTAWQFTVSEVAREASSIGLFPKFLAKVNRFRSPYVAIGTLVGIQIIMTACTMSPSLLKQFNILINLAVMINLVPYLLTMSSVQDLMKKENVPKEESKFATIAAILGGIYSCYAVYGCGWTVIMEGAFVAAMGVLVYQIVSPRLRYTSAPTVSTYPPFINKK